MLCTLIRDGRKLTMQQLWFPLQPGSSFGVAKKPSLLVSIRSRKWQTPPRMPHRSRKWQTPPTNTPEKARNPNISLPDIKVVMLFQVTDENKMLKQFLLHFYGYIVLPASFFIKKSCGAPGFSPGQVILGFKPAKSSEMKS